MIDLLLVLAVGVLAIHFTLWMAVCAALPSGATNVRGSFPWHLFIASLLASAWVVLR